MVSNQNFYGFPQGIFPLANIGRYFPAISVFVVGKNGNYSTIQEAINAAHKAGGGTVYIQEGTYTENLILYSGVDLWGAVGIADTGTCLIAGTHTPPNSGSVTIRNIWLQSDTDIFYSTDAGESAILLIDINVQCTNGYTFNLANWKLPGSFTIFDGASIGAVNDGVVNNTGGAFVFITTATIGAGSANPMIISGGIELFGCVVQCPVHFITGSSALIEGGTLFNNPISLLNNSTGSINNSTVSSGSSQAITMNSSGTWSITQCTINSSNNPAIGGTGLGNLTLSGIDFISNSSLAGTLTLTTSSTFIAGEIRANADIGGSAGFTSLTSTNSTVISTGDGSIKMSSSNPRTNSAWIKIYIGTTPYWIPAWSTNTP